MSRSFLDYRTQSQRHAATAGERVDDTATFIAALADGAGVVELPIGDFYASNVTVPQGVTVVGQGTATVLRPAGDGPVFLQHDVGRWEVARLTLDGGSSVPWEHAEDKGQVGLSIERGWGYAVRDVTLRHFRGPAIRVAHTDIYRDALFCDGGVLAGITAHDNAVGVRFDERGEYTTLRDSHLYRNGVGCEIRAGNVKLLGSNLGGNLTGLRLDDLINGSHGVVANCLLNHNQRYALDARNVHNGMVVQGCCMYYGEVRLVDCTGVHIHGGQLGCSCSTSGAGVNQFSHNFVAMEDSLVFDWSPQTLLHGNFSAKGAWPTNP